MAVIAPSDASAHKVALVAGISDYSFSPKLRNPHHDASAMAAALSRLGFEVVNSIDDDLAGLSEKLERFYARAEGAEEALFFYAGHGLQFEGINYLVPRTARLRSETTLKQETIALQDVIAAVEKRAGISLFFLDACRDNPLADELQRNAAKGSGRSAAVARGLAPMTIRNPDTLVVFAAAPGRTASDGIGKNSPFTTALLANLDKPGIEIELMMKRVTRDVVQATKGEQIPERLSRLTTELMLNPGSAPSGRTEASVPSSSAAAALVTPAAPAPHVGYKLETRAGHKCIAVGPRLTEPIDAVSGTRICAAASSSEAVVKNITRAGVIYSVDGGYEITCRPVDKLCGFDWPGGPMFRVRLVQHSDDETPTSAVLEPAR